MPSRASALRGQEEAVAVPVNPPVQFPDDLKPEEVARLAYQYWEERGRPTGTPEEDWFRAEEQVKLRLNEKTQATKADRPTT